jgi:outer membrane protein OmpA-like peptidoglycan-associated protein
MRIKQTIVVLFTATALGSFGCATKTGTGAAVGGAGGAAVGAGIGAAAGGKKGALIGAAVGATAGAGSGALIGRYMDKQEEELRRKVQAARIEREGDKLLVKFNSQILFDTNKSVIKPEARNDLADFARVLKEYDDTNLRIEGHTDSTGPRDFNEELSVARANAVIQFLTDQGVKLDRMAARGYADDRPVASNDTASGRQQNRRVQIQIEANEELKRQDARAARADDRGEDRAATKRSATTR